MWPSELQNVMKTVSSQRENLLTSAVPPEVLEGSTNRDSATTALWMCIIKTKSEKKLESKGKGASFTTTGTQGYTTFTPEMDVDITKKENRVNIATLKKNVGKVSRQGWYGAARF